MKIADKIIKLRKKCAWSQEDLAEKVNVSRQSVSKWESAASIPDLNKIIIMADLFGVTTDYLVKDDIEEVASIGEDIDPGVIKLSLEDVQEYVKAKMAQSRYISLGVLLCICSIIPLLTLLALSEGRQFGISSDIAVAIGVTLMLLIVAAGVSLFLRSTQFQRGIVKIEEENFELAYGVRGVFIEKLENIKTPYIQKMSLNISLIIVSVIPLIITALFSESDTLILMMLVLMLSLIGYSIYGMIPSVSLHSTYNFLLGEGEYTPSKKDETRRAEKLGAFYWPLVAAFYIGWSLWTMNWGITWIVWPVAGIAFAAFVGLMGLFPKEK